MRMRARFAAATVLFCLCAAACREEVVQVRVPKEPPPAAAPSMKDGAAFPTARADRLRWSLPKGWKELAASGMRAATLVPPSGAGSEVSVFALPGDAGGQLSNVNRWRGQIGLPALDEAALTRARRTLTAPAGTVSLYDFTSAGQAPSRVAAAILTIGEDTWFFKLTGPREPVGAALPDFVKLLESLHSHAP